MTRNARINWVIEWNEREMCYRNYERVIPFSMQATLEEAHPAPGIFSWRRCITDLCWPVNVSVCNGKAERCIRHLDCLSWSREAYLTRNSRTRWLNCPLPVEHLTFLLKKDKGWLSLRCLSLMSEESRRYIPMLRQANILQPATVEAMRDKLKADYRLIPSCYETEAEYRELA